MIRNVRLPKPLDRLIQQLPTCEQEQLCHALGDAFADAGITIEGRRMDAVVGRGYSVWAVPTPQLTNLTQELAATLAVWATGGKQAAIAVAAMRVVWPLLASWRMRTRLLPDQAEVLRVLIKAPKGDGWRLDEILARLPTDSVLSEQDVVRLMSELRSLTDASGDATSWKVHEREARFWVSGI